MPSSWYKEFMAGHGVDVGSRKPDRSRRPAGPLPTLGHYRNDHGIRTFTVHCLNGVRCWHKARLDFADLPDDTIAISLDARMVCTQCGLIGADVRVNWDESPTTNRNLKATKEQSRP